MTGDKKFHHEYGTEHGYAPIAHQVLCIDFDATLFPWGELMNWEAQPIPGAVTAVQRMAAKGFDIRIFTSRMSQRWLRDSGNHKSEQYEYVHKMCTKWGIPFTEIIGEKVPAMAYIDDKAIEFTGDNWDAIADRVEDMLSA